MAEKMVPVEVLEDLHLEGKTIKVGDLDIRLPETTAKALEKVKAVKMKQEKGVNNG